MDAAPQSASPSPLGEGERACYAVIMAALSDAVLVVDSAGQPVLANRAFEAFFGAPGERLIDFDANADAVRTRARPGAHRELGTWVHLFRAPAARTLDIA
jgi:PAS domain-containing protein